MRGSSDPAPSLFESEIAAFEKWDRKNAHPRNPILFIGSSSIRLWQTAEAFSDAPVINRGFGGSTIADVNHYFDRVVLKYKPRIIVFYSGDNDIAAGKSPQHVADDMNKFAESVQDNLPETTLYVLSIKPSVAREKLWPKMHEANTRLKHESAVNGKFTFIDISAPMLDSGGRPRRELFLDDNLHMNDKGYAIWNKAVSPLMKKAVKRE